MSMPHGVGDRGQRYEVSYLDPRDNKRHVVGWTDDLKVAKRMGEAVDVHPVWEDPEVLDRKAAGLL